MNGNKLKQSACRNRKNVVFILVDDLGWMDVALNGSSYYETPNVQRLADQGMTFTNAYAHPLCSPTRSALLTGQYPHRTGINAPACHLPDNTEGFTFDPKQGQPWQEYLTKNSLRALPLNLYTIGQAFRDNGYKTGFMGKQHLGVNSEYKMGNRGFDVDLGMPVPGPGSYYNPYFPGIPGNVFDTGSLFKDGENITDRLAREADKFITENKDISFLLEVWDFSVHAPFQGKKEYIEYFRKKNVPSSPQNGNFHMGAMLKTMDDLVGKVLDSLERNELSDNTMIVFMGDNGGNMYDAIDGHFPTNNYPLRQGKGTIYEGGIRVPCVVKVPGVAAESSICNENIHAVDFYPTLLEYAGINIPKDIFSQNGQVLDGMSIMPLLSGKRKTLNRAGVFTNFIANVPSPGNTASASINSGKWKLIINYELLGGLKQKYELYDLEENISETVNLASLYPEKVTELEGYIIEHQDNIPQAEPKINPSYNKEAIVPPAYRRWDKWTEEFAQKIANDPDIKGKYPMVVRINDITAFYEKIKNSIVMKIDKPVVILNKYDDKIDGNIAPTMISDVVYIPLKYVAEKSGFTYTQTCDTATLTKNNDIITIEEDNISRAVILNNEFMLPSDTLGKVTCKTIAIDSSGLIIIDDIKLHLTGCEIALANNYINSFAAYENAYWKAEKTISMVKQAEMEDEWESVKININIRGGKNK